MGRINAPFINFNGGEIGQEVIGRVNLEGYAACAALLENWLPEAEGPMSKRPGFEFKSQPIAGDPFVLLHPFVFSVSQKALLCFSDNELRIAQDGAIISRSAVTSTIPNSSFNTASTNLAPTPTAGQAVASGSLAALVDGSAANGAISGATATQTFTFDLTTAQAVSCLEIWAPLSSPENAPGAYFFAGSATGSFTGEQSTMFSVSSSSAWAAGERRVHLFAANTFRYWRLTITAQQDGGTGSYAMNEIRFHNAGWADASLGATSIAATNSVALGAPGLAILRAERGGRAALQSRVLTSNTDEEHILDVDVFEGPVTIKVGTTAGASDLLSFDARTGRHSVAFTPTSGVYYIEISTTESIYRLVSAISIAAAGDLVLPTPWAEADLRSLRFVQQNDVVFVASGIGHMKRIERRGPGSWSIVNTDERDGPFLDPNLDSAITLTPSATSGDITVTSSLPLFVSGHLGAIFQLTHTGQTVNAAINGVGQVTDQILVTGIDNDRIFRLTITGTWTGTLTLQRSVGNDTSFADTATTYTANQANIAVNDTFDNQIIYYRLRASAWTSGTATIAITYSGGTTVGVIRIRVVSSSTLVTAQVLSQLGSLNATSEWAEGAWSDARYWPKAIGLFDARLWSAAEDRLWGSRSNSFENHELTDLDTSAIARYIATGDVNPAMWILPLTRMLIGTEGAEVSIRESTQDGVLTDANLTMRDIGTAGSADYSPVRIDTQGVAIDRSTIRATLIGYSVEAQDYTTQSLMRLHRDIGRPGLLQMAVSRHPETRLWMVRSDGQLLTKAFTPGEAVLGWSRIITDGEVESVAVLPGIGEDEIYIMVARTIDGSTVRYLEKLADFYYETTADACRVDSAVIYSGAAVTSCSVPHLIGEVVRIWGDGARMPDQTVPPSGIVTFTRAVTKYAVGLGYRARYKSPRLSFGSQGGTAVGQQARSLTVILDLLASAPSLRYGDSFNRMDPLTDRELTDTYDAGPGMRTGVTKVLTMPVESGKISRDPVFCLESDDAAPSRLRAYVLGHQLNERVGG